MPTRILKRLRAEDGVSLVEMLVALTLIAVGLMALLTTLTASASSLVNQRARTGATRVASAHMEGLRARGYDGVKADLAAGVYATPITRDLDGRRYTITTAVEERDAQTGGAVVAGRESVLKVVTTVAWGAGDGARSSTFETALAAEGQSATPGGGGGGGGGTCIAGAERSIDSINLLPSPVAVDASGQPLEDIKAVVKLCGFTSSALVQLHWTKDGEGGKSTTLASDDGGITWRGTVSRNLVKRLVDVGGIETLDFELKAGTLSQLHALELTRQAATTLEVVSAQITPNPIRVQNSNNNCNGAKKCTNVEAVVFSAEVLGIDPTVDSVKLKYQLHDGTFREVAMTYSGSGLRWNHTDPKETVKYKVGVDQAFQFIVTRATPSGVETTSKILNRTVTH